MPHCSLLQAFRPKLPTGLLPLLFVRGLHFRRLYDRPRLPSPWLISHCDYSPNSPAVPSLKPFVTSSSLIRCALVHLYRPHPCSFPRAVLWTSLLSFQRGSTPPQCAVNHRSPMVYSTVPFTTFRPRVFLMVLLNALSLPRRSCHLAPRLFIPLLQSGRVRHLLLSVRPFRVSSCNIIPDDRAPWRGAGMALRVIRLRPTANFFRDPPPPWVRFFSYRRYPTAKCRSPYRPFIAPINSTAASSLGTAAPLRLASIASWPGRRVFSPGLHWRHPWFLFQPSSFRGILTLWLAGFPSFLPFFVYHDDTTLNCSLQYNNLIQPISQSSPTSDTSGHMK
jgi:hypothetical protein